MASIQTNAAKGMDQAGQLFEKNSLKSPTLDLIMT